VLIMNVARVTCVTFLLKRWGINLLEGWTHEAFGLFIFAIILGLLVSTDRLLLFFVPVRGPQAREAAVEGNRPDADRSLRAEPGHILTALRATWLAAPAVAAAYAALVCGEAWLNWGGRAGDPSGDAVVRSMEERGAEALPARRGTWQRQDFKTERRDRLNLSGEFSRMWHYQWGPHNACVSLDYPFDGWHALNRCYVAQGWALEGMEYHWEDANAGSGCYAEMLLSKPAARWVYVLFGVYDGQGRPQEPELEMGWRDYLHSRLVKRHAAYVPTYQVQLAVESSPPLTPGERNQALAFFRHVRDVLCGPVAPPEDQP
jgi:hypothetical protein